jgi:hypothetical protein
MKYIIPKLIGGLGNQLFILAAAMDVSMRYGRTLVLNNKPGNPHSNDKFTLLDLFPSLKIIPNIQIDKEYSGSDFNYKDILSDILSDISNESKNLFISGYNQHPKYIPDIFCNFIYNIPEISNYTNMKDVAFIHVRRGDYVNHPTFVIDTDKYYTSAVKHILTINPNIKLLILSDDLIWSNYYIMNLLRDLIPNENIIKLDRQYTPIETLKIMANCHGGSICANSSFSWWGAYVNKDRPIYMPYPWCSYDISPTLGLYFDKVNRVSWENGEIIDS